MKKPERVVLQASPHGLTATFTSLTRDQSIESGPVQLDFLDAVLHADGRGFQMHCYDSDRDVSATLHGFPIEVLKYLEVVRTLFEREGGNGTIQLTIKGGSISSLSAQPQGQDAREIDLAQLSDLWNS